jgi:hypothetical protein
MPPYRKDWALGIGVMEWLNRFRFSRRLNVFKDEGIPKTDQQRSSIFASDRFIFIFFRKTLVFCCGLPLLLFSDPVYSFHAQLSFTVIYDWVV